MAVAVGDMIKAEEGLEGDMDNRFLIFQPMEEVVELLGVVVEDIQESTQVLLVAAIQLESKSFSLQDQDQEQLVEEAVGPIITTVTPVTEEDS